ncbi:MAG: DUF4921 family protein [Candidatus Omnitrophica bacterium]|nr:DUF4921 family protein [Candidatus Omnitrophota bacterium]
MSELRKDPISGRWVIIAEGRSLRPGAFVKKNQPPASSAAPACPFCAGHEGETPLEVYTIRDPKTKPNTPGWKVRVVPNKFPALGQGLKLVKKARGMYDMMTGFGAHEVVIETPHHGKEAKDQSNGEISAWLRALQLRVGDLRKDENLRYVLIFKNKGKTAGASLEHPHHQIIATPVTPKRVREELIGAMEYFKLKERCVFCDVIEEERSNGQRIIYENEDYISFCPYASRFPYEIWILPKAHGIDFHTDVVRKSLPALAEHLKRVLGSMSDVLGDPEYNYLFHVAPNRFPRFGYWRTIENDFHWHIELFPRLTIVAGFEWGSGFYINPVLPEEAAKALRVKK